MKTIIKNGLVISMDTSRQMYEKVDIVYEDNIIIFVGNNYNEKVDNIIDATDKIVMPGLINCHTHLGMSIFRATNDNYTLDKWLKEYIWPIEDNMTDNDMYYATLLSLIEMIKTGTTCFNDMYFNWKGSYKAFNEIKVRGIYSRCIMGELDEKGYKYINDFLDSYKSNTNELIHTFVAPHSLYMANIDYLKECNNISIKYNLPVHIHVAENDDEVNTILNKYNTSPINVLKESGLLDRKLVIAHGTSIKNDEIELLKNKDVSICTNPISNLNLGCGIAPIKEFLDNNINVCLGTDGVGSGNNLNMFYHMSLLDNLNKAKYKDPTVISSYEVLKIATINGAKALGLDKEIGSIEIGKKADIIILDLNNIEIFPTIDPIIQVVHNAWNSVDTTIINGITMMNNRKLNIDIDLDKLKAEITNIRKKLL